MNTHRKSERITEVTTEIEMLDRAI